MRRRFEMWIFVVGIGFIWMGCGGNDEGASTADVSSRGAGHRGPFPIRAVLGEHNPKVKTQEGKTYIWAHGELPDPFGEHSHWYDFTDAPMPARELQYGIGQDRILAVDDPVFVAPDDPRLLGIPVSPYRPDERPSSNDQIMVIGYVDDGVARAYPTALLDRHELVNDQFHGKPLAVGW